MFVKVLNQKFVLLVFIFLGSVLGTPDENSSNTTYIDTEDSSLEDHILIQDENSTFQQDCFTFTTIKYYLFPPPPFNETIELNSTNLNLVNTSQPLKIIIHGLGNYEKHVWIDKMAALYHTKGAYNVLAVDWSIISSEDSFYVASMVNSLGEAVGDFIIEVSQDHFEHLRDVHLIGSNVGAQVGGAAGETVVAKTNTTLGRITGLNPTQPEDLEILNKDDAEFVDVIHSSVSLGEKGIGTVDFYINADDPNNVFCPNDNCGDYMVEDMYIMTIEDEDRFEGISCYYSAMDKLCDKANSAVMGEGVPRNISGYYLVGKGTMLTLSRYMWSIIIAPLLVLIIM